MGMLDYTGEKSDTLPLGLPANLNKIKFVKKNLLANTRSVLGGGCSVAVLCAFSGNTITYSFTMRAAVLWRVQQQLHSSPSAGTRPQLSAKCPDPAPRPRRTASTFPTSTRTSGTASRSRRRSRGSSGRPRELSSPAKRADSQQGVAWSNG